MRHAHGAVGLVDVLAAGAGGAHRIDADILHVELHIDVFRLREHRHRRRRRMYPPARFRFRHALHPVYAAFVFHPTEHALAGNAGDDFAIAAEIALGHRVHIELPALDRGVALIHAEKIAGEQRRFLSARAGANFQDR